MDAGSIGRGSQFLSRNSLTPWNSRQSTRTRRPATSSRCFEPVTVPAAPRKVREKVTFEDNLDPLPVRAYRIIVSAIKIPLHPVESSTRRGDPAMDDKKMSEELTGPVSRRGFIKGVIAAGTVASSSAYLFRSTTLHGQLAGAGSVERLITLNVNGQDRRIDVMPEETVAMTLG